MSETSRIRVKFLNRTPPEMWLKMYFPDGIPSWGRCDFIFDWNSRDYDWLVVYDDLPPNQGERRAMREEVLACPRGNSLLLTSEPHSIKVYGKAITGQYGWVITSQEEWALPHPHRVYRQQAMHRHYGLNMTDADKSLSFNDMVEHPPLEKSKDLATVCSSKQQQHTLHNKRYQFTQALKELLPEMDIYGHGVRYMDDKKESLDPYRYHLAIENFVGPHHLTEKLTDVFLGCALPFYYGCPNASDYFPQESFIPIDIDDVSGSAEIIARAISDNEYEKRLPAIMQARKLALYDYSLFAIVAREIEARHMVGPASNAQILSRWLYLKRHPFKALQFMLERRRLGSL